MTAINTNVLLPRRPRAAQKPAAAPFHQMTLADKLNRLAELREAEAMKAAKIDRKIAKLMEQRDELVAVEALAIDQLECQIKAECLEEQATVCGAALQVIFVKGRRSWDTDRLEGYATDHPDILQFRKEGQPTAKIVPVSSRN